LSRCDAFVAHIYRKEHFSEHFTISELAFVSFVEENSKARVGDGKRTASGHTEPVGVSSVKTSCSDDGKGCEGAPLSTGNPFQSGLIRAKVATITSA
jgi:hypothetical protein